MLTETPDLRGGLLGNAKKRYICQTVGQRVGTTDSSFTSQYKTGQVIDIPIVHHDGNYTADVETLRQLDAENRVAFRYVCTPNGATDGIAGILSENRRILGMMPHPERASDPMHGGTDGAALFRGLAEALVSA